jgi:predicted nucleotidyltransferase
VLAHHVPTSVLDAIPDFCRRWRVREFSLFGSVLREEFGPTSDVDVLLDFDPGAFWGIDEWIAMRDELEALFGRRVDVVSRASLRNPFRRHEILRTRRVLHAA